MSLHAYPIIVVVGAQYGSEAKGMVAASLGKRRMVDLYVRTGTINSGHTVYYKGRKFVMQQLPTGWVNHMDDTNVRLVIGPGAYIHPPTLERELAMIREQGFQGDVLIDMRCGLHLPEHTERAAVAGRHYLMGATGKGCSEAVMDKIRLRGQSEPLYMNWVEEHDEAKKLDVEFCDTTDYLNDAYDGGEKILIEGTQGTMLDLHLGPYPYVTHKQCIAASWIAECGLSPALNYEVVLVARTYPIRVAGNSGPLPNETDWPTVAEWINTQRLQSGFPAIVGEWALSRFRRAYAAAGLTEFPSPLHRLSEQAEVALRSLDLETQMELAHLFEFTSVTKKLRRIGQLDLGVLNQAVSINRPAWIALTFLNYRFPYLWGETAEIAKGDFLRVPMIQQYLDHIYDATCCRVKALSTGPEDQHFHDFSG